MPLFCVNGKPLLFDLINLDEAEHAAYTCMIEREGGGVTSDENTIVKFTSRDAYLRNHPPVRAKIYDVRFIEECIKQGQIVRPDFYRLDVRIGDDDYHVQHFLYGHCGGSWYEAKCCEIRQQAQADLAMVYGGQKLTGDSDSSVDDNEPMDEAQPVPSAFLELEMSSSSSEGGGEPVNSLIERRTPLKPKAKRTYRRLPKFRNSLPVNVGNSFGSAPEVTISTGGPNANQAPELITDGVSFVASTPRGDNSRDAGPSGVRIALKRHPEDNGESLDSENLFRNDAHNSIIELSSGLHDEVEGPKTDNNVIKKTSRGQEWRAKLKSQTEAKYTGVKTRAPFTPSERKTMLNYLVKNGCIDRAKGLIVWTQMITEGFLTERTPQSLQNQFRKHVLPNIEAMDLEASDKQKFLALRSDKR